MQPQRLAELSPIVMRGLSDRVRVLEDHLDRPRIAAARFAPQLAISSPSRRISARCRSSSRDDAAPSVDLPQPLSPTSPSVSPAPDVEVTPSTALTCACACGQAARIGKCLPVRLRQLSAWAVGPAAPAALAIASLPPLRAPVIEPAADLLRLADSRRSKRGSCCRHGSWTLGQRGWNGSQAAAEWARHHPGNGIEPPFAASGAIRRDRGSRPAYRGARGSANSRRTSHSSTISPAYMTATRRPFPPPRRDRA